MINFRQSFSNNLKSLLGEMSINEFSRQVGIPAQTISRYINCQRVVKIENLIKIADFFDEDIDFLIGRKQY